MLQGQRPVATNIRDNTEILLDLADQRRISAGQPERVLVLPLGLDQVATLERESGKRVARICRQILRVCLNGNLVAPVAKIPRDLRLGANVVENGKSAQCFRPNPGLLAPRGQIDDCRVALHRLYWPTAQVVSASFAEQFLEARVTERIA